MKYKIHFAHHVVCLAAAALLLAACDKDVFDINTDPFKDQTYTTTLTSPISSLLEETEGYSEYVKLLHYSNMFNALNQSSSGISFTSRSHVATAARASPR